MIITILSGKGGTGKTTIAANLAMAGEKNVQLLDCDVEEPNAHLLIKPKILERQKVAVQIPRVDSAKCTLCGKCQEVCAFNAIAVLKEKVLLFPEICHSCGVCSYFCPQQAIEEVDKEVGVVEIGTRSDLQFVHGELNVGEAIAIPIIRSVKKHINPTRTVIIDAPPGTSCPVIETVKESDYCVVVTEPTPFGFNDFRLVVDLLKKLNRPFGAIINRSDLGNKQTEEYCQAEGIHILKRIPFSHEMAYAYSKGELMVEVFPEYKSQYFALLGKIQKLLK